MSASPALSVSLALFWVSTISASDSAPGVRASVLITLEARHAQPSSVTPGDLRVEEKKQSRPVDSLEPLADSPTQLLMLIDDSAGGSFDTQIPEVRDFLHALPASVEVAIGYMHNGTSTMLVDSTNDHAKAAAQVRLPMGTGGADVSPYDSLAEAIKKWPAKPLVKRREVIMIGSGLEGLGGGPPPENPYVNAAIAAAQKAGIVVYAIYNPGFGHDSHSFWRAASGQNFLSQLTDETGGELYQLGFSSAVSLQPFFADFLSRQNHQYLLSFEAGAENRSGLYPLKVSTSKPDTSVAAPDKIYVKASL